MGYGHPQTVSKDRVKKLTSNLRSGNSIFEKATKQLETRLGIPEAAVLMKYIYQHTEEDENQMIRSLCEAYGVLL